MNHQIFLGVCFSPLTETSQYKADYMKASERIWTLVGNAGVFLNQGQKTTRLNCCLQFSLLAFYSCVSAAYFSVTLKKVLTLCISGYKSFSSSRKYKAVHRKGEWAETEAEPTGVAETEGNWRFLIYLSAHDAGRGGGGLCWAAVPFITIFYRHSLKYLCSFMKDTLSHRDNMY